MVVLEQGLAVLEWTATASPNSKNRALAARTRRLVLKAREAISRLPPPPVSDFLTSVGIPDMDATFPSSNFTLDIPLPTAVPEWAPPVELETLMPMPLPLAPASNDDQFDAWLAMLFPPENEQQGDWMLTNEWPA